jgi:hypothetical protein
LFRHGIANPGIPRLMLKKLSFGTTLDEVWDRTGVIFAGAFVPNQEVVMSAHDSNTWGRSLPEGIPPGEVVPQAAVDVQGDTKSDILIDFTDSHVVDFEGLTLLLTAQRLAHSEDRQVWLMGLPDTAWTVLEAMGLADLFVRVGSPRNQSN